MWNRTTHSWLIGPPGSTSSWVSALSRETSSGSSCDTTGCSLAVSSVTSPLPGAELSAVSLECCSSASWDKVEQLWLSIKHMTLHFHVVMLSLLLSGSLISKGRNIVQKSATCSWSCRGGEHASCMSCSVSAGCSPAENISSGLRPSPCGAGGDSKLFASFSSACWYKTVKISSLTPACIFFWILWYLVLSVLLCSRHLACDLQSIFSSLQLPLIFLSLVFSCIFPCISASSVSEWNPTSTAHDLYFSIVTCSVCGGGWGLSSSWSSFVFSVFKSPSSWFEVEWNASLCSGSVSVWSTTCSWDKICAA